MSKNTGGPAYPIGSGDMRDPTGLTIRDHFAGLAMQGFLSSWGLPFPDETNKKYVATQAYRIADEMLAEREKE